MTDDADTSGASAGPVFGQPALDVIHARRPFPPAELVRAGAALICGRDLVPRRIVGGVVPAPR